MNINTDDPKSIFYTFLNGSIISYIGAGSGGLGLELVNTDYHSYKILSLDNKYTVCHKLFLKLIPIVPDYVEYDLTLEFLVPNSRMSVVYASTKAMFWDEVVMQNTVYKKSNHYLQSICPPIVYSEHQNNSTSINFITSLFDKYWESKKYDKDLEEDDPLTVFKKKYSSTTILSLGIIAMSFTDNYVPLYRIVHEQPSNSKFYYELAIVELIRLYSIGFFHGDFSLMNIMVNPSYNYMGMPTGRAMLIDFGMSFTYPRKNFRNYRMLLETMLRTRVPANNVVPSNHDNYKWLARYIDTYGETLEMSIKQLIHQIELHTKTMISMTQEMYPELLQQIRNYNNTTIHDNVFRGGFIQDTQVISNELTIQNTHKENIDQKEVKNMSVNEFNAIFNPQKIDMNKLKDEYLHTLMLGEMSIKEVLKQKTTTGGRKQKKHKSRTKRQRKHKSRTKKHRRTKKRSKKQHSGKK